VVKLGDTIDISIGEKHHISADENGILSFIEVQTGSSFHEQDIVRYADGFGRTI
jgi:mannose-6-phosphate isomerase-like protein (cupin superfamily)